MGGILEQRVNTLPPDDLASLAATYAACAAPYTPPSSSSSSSSASAAPINSSASTRRLLGLVTKAAQDKIDLFKPTDFAELVWGIATHEAAVLALPTASELREPWQATHAFMKAAGGVVSETASRLKPSLFVAMVCAVATVTAECCAPSCALLSRSSRDGSAPLSATRGKRTRSRAHQRPTVRLG